MRERLTEWGVPESRSTVIPMGVDLGPARDTRARVAPQEHHVVAVGRLVEKKGFGNLIEALRGLGDDVPWRLTVVGDGPYRAQLEQQAAGLPVTFLGQRGRTEVLETLASATVVAVPSIPAANGDQEGLPVTLLEAAAVGAAIVASDLPGIRDVVQDDVSGVLVPPGDVPALRAALQRVLTDDAARSRYQEQAVVSAAEFSTERIGERYRAVLRAAIG
ncbi:hypothetical protein DEJ04_08990 [Curtobacterium sp. MCLR17_044]|nr:hypothetical protein DEJ09_08260 [Curtobacterium sp. MCLR17_055]PZE58776.1 hypothetical protein DEJ04_08990 [Curtobacterium sp. MCLR17_044]PZF42724.1 hypothetical protein DEJ07_06040 [Curtobacterium sp. MCLR17_053]